MRLKRRSSRRASRRSRRGDWQGGVGGGGVGGQGGGEGGGERGEGLQTAEFAPSSVNAASCRLGVLHEKQNAWPPSALRVFWGV